MLHPPYKNPTTAPVPVVIELNIIDNFIPAPPR